MLIGNNIAKEKRAPEKNRNAGLANHGKNQGEEMVDVIDAKGKVLRVVPRPEMRKHNLRHRSTFVLVFDSRGRLLVSKRTESKDIYPGRHEVTHGGTVAHGETFEENAYRELEEELGIRGIPLQPLFTFSYEDKMQNCLGKVFKCTYDGPIKLQKEEVVSYAFVPIEEIRTAMQRHPGQYCDDGRVALQRYLMGKSLENRNSENNNAGKENPGKINPGRNIGENNIKFKERNIKPGPTISPTIGPTIRPHSIFEVYHDRNRIYTRSMLPGRSHFEERLVRQGQEEYREFDPRRSKLAAMILKGCKNIFLRPGNVVLYLGVSHGYTASFVSDILGPHGLLFGVDPAPRVMRDFVFLAEERANLVPVMADANHPEEYADRICAADIIYQDLAQRNQEDIFTRNCALFLKEGGYGLLCVKARSIDVSRKPRQIFEEVHHSLKKNFTIIDFRSLEPYEKDHCMIIVKKVA